MIEPAQRQGAHDMRVFGSVARGEADEASMKVREAIRLIEADGWRLVSQRGSHRQFKHPTKPGRVTIPGNPGIELKPGTLASIRRQAQLQ